MSEIHASYQWTAEQYIAAFRQHWKASIIRRLLLWTMIALLVLMAVAYAVLTSEYRLNSSSIAAVCAAVFVLVMWLPIQRLMIRWRFPRRPDANATVNFVIEDEGIRSDVPGLAQGNCSWANIDKVADSDYGLLIYPSENIFQWLPRTAFRAPEDYQAARRLITSKVARVKTLR